MIYYLDASAWVKRYIVESGRAVVERLFESEDTLVSADLGAVEVAATLARRLPIGKTRKRIFSAFGGDLDVVQLVPQAPEVVTQALALAVTHSLRGADALHLATMVLVRAAAAPDAVILVTADRELASAAAQEGFEVLEPRSLGGLEEEPR